MTDKKISELQSVVMPLSGMENIPVVQDGNTRKLLVSDILLDIPTPRILIGKDDFNFKTIFTSWHSYNTAFLDYDAKYYLFRYRGKHRKIINNNPKFDPKGFRHPTHNNGNSNTTSYTAWWRGASSNHDGSTVPPRVTEWQVPIQAGEKINLDILKSDWVYTRNVPPCDISDFVVKGAASRSARSAYFSLAIGINIGEYVPGKCPIIFGPMSSVFCLRPRYDYETGLWSNWDWSLV